MNHIKKIIFCLFLFLLSSNMMFAQMSDEQIINYVKQEVDKGTSQQIIATNLMKQGVTKGQLERIKEQQEQKQTSGTTSTKSSSELRRDRKESVEDDLIAGDLDQVNSNVTPDALNDENVIEVFGKNIFNAKNLTFSPNINIPTPIDYRLGPGDEVVIDIWGASQTSVRQVISAEGSITVDRLGPLFLNGMSVKEANDYVQRKFGDIYSGLDSGGSTQIKLTLGQIRTIQINVMGEVVTPGTYSLSSLSSVFHALYRAGGVNNIGSLRSIKLYRNGKLLRVLDIYKYILEGKMNDDIRMTDGDVIIVPPYISLVNMSGKVKRPMLYEMTSKETLEDLISYAGGFTGDAYTKSVRVVRESGGENKIFTLGENEYSDFTLGDKDVVSIGSGLDLYENRVEIKGAIYRTGYYEIGKNITTVKQLIAAADGLRGDAFLNRAILTREKDDYTLETLPIDIRELLYSNGNDIVLRKNDILYIPSINDLQEFGDFTVHGEVARPGRYKYSDNKTLEDLIIEAGGLLESASVVRVDIARRVINPHSQTVNRTLAENYTFSLKDGYIVNGDPGFVLKPYDEIYVRRSPGYHAQQNVFINGELLFPGAYALNRKTERISDIVKRAGNLTADAYPKGARLIRMRSEEELFRSQAALKVANQGGKDSISVRTLDLANAYSVGIELDKALLNPGSDYDLVLRPGDRLIVPEYDNTVKINGAVMYPNTVVYKQGERLAHYINQAGGYSDNAKKNRSFVIYMNGTVTKVKSGDRNAIQPGSEIIIPSKEQSKRLSLPEILSLSTSVVSMASLIGVLINTMK
ncbi:protein involved in polysaccharide export with SLBB domain [Dysgonomonas alginatilytica]|uniref:Protein involved in polysaccharide export with SLBB domain n=1 Tax=Dysgonomonas alginatilytica TaxID=1605892 RepID=A0A2V3PN99_9BACT|nr:protein involved in polysaccharide export with SLBB domain [Dysgonomonas alginatilytica]